MAKRTRKLDQIDLVQYIEEVKKPKQLVPYRVLTDSNGNNYSHLPMNQRPLRWLEE